MRTPRPAYARVAARASVKIAYSIAYFACMRGRGAGSLNALVEQRQPPGGRSGDVVLRRPSSGVAAVLDTDFGQDAGDVVHDRAGADRELGRNLTIGGPPRQ